MSSMILSFLSLSWCLFGLSFFFFFFNDTATTEIYTLSLHDALPIDFGLIVDGAVIIAENCLRHLANRQHQLGRQLDLPERLETVRLAAKEMVAPSVYGQTVIMLVYIPLLTFSGVEGKMFEPMALTV